MLPWPLTGFIFIVEMRFPSPMWREKAWITSGSGPSEQVSLKERWAASATLTCLDPNRQQLEETTGEIPSPAWGVSLWVRVWVGLLNWSALTVGILHRAIYLQGSVLAEGGHALHEATHLVCHRLHNLGQDPRHQVLGDGEDLGRGRELISRETGASSHRSFVCLCVLPQREQWWCSPELPSGSSSHLREEKLQHWVRTTENGPRTEIKMHI